MKSVEILTKAGKIMVREKDLGRYKSRGDTMADGSEIVTPAEVADQAKGENEKRKLSEEVKAAGLDKDGNLITARTAKAAKKRDAKKKPKADKPKE